jgi:hypothetical protein
MKTIFTLLILSVMSLAAIAAPNKDVRPSTMLTIRSVDRAGIHVVIDGRRFDPNRNFMRVQNLHPGSHRVKILRERSGGFNFFGNRYDVVFNNSINVRNGSEVMISVDRYGRTDVRENRMYGWNDRDYRGRDVRNPDNRRYNEDDRNYPDYNNRDWNRDNDFDFDRDSQAGDYNTGRDGRTRDYGNGSDDRNFNDYSYNNAMSDLDFSNVLRSMQKEWFEKNRAKSASQIISSSYFTSGQVKQILQMFTFEDMKLDLAKQAYGKTVDQRNYGIVNDVFSFSGSRDELARHIRSFR